MTKQIIFKVVIAAVIAVFVYLFMTSVDKTTRITAGFIILIPSFILLIIARINLGKSFSVMPKAMPLVTTGFYSKLRHPLYVFVDLTLLGIIILTGIGFLLILWVLFILMQSTQANREEKVLTAEFGDEYKRYKEQTWF